MVVGVEINNHIVTELPDRLREVRDREEGLAFGRERIATIVGDGVPRKTYSVIKAASLSEGAALFE
ncbi:MAG: hypothetical protein R3F11_28670 [Verrucomicrobiales bacterium]